MLGRGPISFRERPDSRILGNLGQHFSVPCLRRTPSQTRKCWRVSGEEERVETRKDALEVIRDGGYGALGPGIEPAAATNDVDAVLADLARAVDRDLSTPDLAPATERAYAHDWADFAAFCARHGLEALPAAPQTLALYLKSLETARSRAPSAYQRRPPAERIYIGPVGLALPTLRRRLAAIAVRHTAAGHETPTDHPLVRRMLRRYAHPRDRGQEERAADNRAPAGDRRSYAGRPTGDARSRADPLGIRGGLSPQRARGARPRRSSIHEEGTLRLDRRREE